MPPLLDSLARSLDDRIAARGRPARAIVAFSGGRDSTALLAALAELLPGRGIALSAAHVHHGLQPAADDWQAHCARQAARLGVPLAVLAVDVRERGGDGLEANARRARYRALGELLDDGDWLLTAHHADDQAETVLLNLMRGSGVAGVRGAAACRPLGRGLLLRPLLDVPGAEITDFCRERGLDWIEDPSNRDTARDRNYLRRIVLPLLAERWPAAARQLGRSAALAADAALLLDELAAEDLAAAGDAGRIELAALAALPAARRRNLLRLACQRLSLPPPPARQLANVLDEVVGARPDAAPRVTWPGAEVRRYREHLYLLPATDPPPRAPPGRLRPGEALSLGAGGGRLLLEAAARGIEPGVARAGLAVRYRRGGEMLAPAGREGRQALKKLLQGAGIVPWMRERIPLLYADDALVAVGDLWVAAEHQADGGYAVRWQGRPALF